TFESTATDSVDGSEEVTCDPASGSTFPLGTTTVTCTATDRAENTGTSTFKVTVKDTTAPSGGSIDYRNGYYTTDSVDITYILGTDSVTGLNTSTGKIQRASAMLANGVCDEFTSFSDLVTESDGSYTDTTVIDGNCYKYQYTIKDKAGNPANYTSDNLAKIDTTNPDISIQDPIPNKWYTNNSIDVNFTVNDTNLDSCRYTVTNETDEEYEIRAYRTEISDGGDEEIISGPCDNFTLENLPEGWHNLTIYVNDSAGNENSSSVLFYTDTIPPVIDIQSPIDQFYPRLTQRVDVNYTVNETNPEQCWYDLNRTESGGLINQSIPL
ncbi:MAG: HYR domain-containing protein, partial [Candidatus Micrarchaeota archaeon]|nr:HYR domain-containing protein [Candidatus Micrarchaeota archaeon]